MSAVLPVRRAVDTLHGVTEGRREFGVLIVEDQKITRDSLARLVGDARGYRVLGTASTGEEALRLAWRTPPDVVLMDLGLPGMGGIEAIRELRKAVPEVEILVLTIFDTDEAVFQSLKAGASGYLLKDSGPKDIIAALDLLTKEKGAPMSPTIARRVIQDFRKFSEPSSMVESLTAREREILDLLAGGHAYKEIADRLGIAFGTVQSHIKNIYQKLQVTSKVEAVAKVFGLSPRS